MCFWSVSIFIFILLVINNYGILLNKLEGFRMIECSKDDK